MWASRVVHHSSERLNLSTAFRQSLTYPVSGMWLFWLPLAWIGFEPTAIVAVVAINLGFQFFVHTQAIGKLGWLEKVFNTPSHHRVHHARNAKYIDRNYAGVLIVWDKLFGTYVEEDDAVPCEYGIVGGAQPQPYHRPSTMARDVCRHDAQATTALAPGALSATRSALRIRADLAHSEPSDSTAELNPPEDRQPRRHPVYRTGTRLHRIRSPSRRLQFSHESIQSRNDAPTLQPGGTYC